MDSQPARQLEQALCSLEGLSVGDAFGECFFHIPDEEVWDVLQERIPPAPPWPYTDDTQMALSIVSILRQYGRVDQERLAQSFAERYDYSRGYGPSMHRLLRRIREGDPWQSVSHGQFEGQGSFGNGAAMRVAPLGAYFAGDLEAVASEAARAAEVTHAHPEAIAGSIAIALAAAWASRLAGSNLPTRREFLDLILPHIPQSEVLSRIRLARTFPEDGSVSSAVAVLGNGSRLSAPDTVPFALWCAAQSLGNYEDALWLAASGRGDGDTICAMVGGIVALYNGIQGIPSAWRDAREKLPHWPLLEGPE